MSGGILVLSYDIGTTGAKTCLYRYDGSFSLLGSGMAEYGLKFLPDGGVEQDPDEWWHAMASTTRSLLDRTGIKGAEIAGISFCGQMQGLVLVDKQGKPVRPAMSYLDQRAGEQKRKGLERGFTISGMNAFKLFPSLMLTGGVSASVKDPLWKYLWVRDNEPEVFGRAYKWLDVKEYLICRCTGRFVMTPDSANATFLYDTRPASGAGSEAPGGVPADAASSRAPGGRGRTPGPACGTPGGRGRTPGPACGTPGGRGRTPGPACGTPGGRGWSDYLCRVFDAERSHLPEIIRGDEAAGPLLAGAASELGLPPGIPVFGGGGDATLIALGSGAVRKYDTHLYMGTSGWVSSVVDKRIVDIDCFIASILGAIPGSYNYFSEQETSGKCMEWIRDHLALDEIGVYLDSKPTAADPDQRNTILYGLLDAAIEQVAPGSDGVIFTPWLHGNRSPFEDSSARGMFFNISVSAGKRSLIRSVVEGIGYHNRWQLEAIRKKVPARGPIRFVGGGARSRVTAQVLADILGEEIEIPADPRNSGALGAAILAVSGLNGLEMNESLRDQIPPAAAIRPRTEFAEIYDRGYRVFRNLYWRNKGNFRALNGN